MQERFHQQLLTVVSIAVLVVFAGAGAALAVPGYDDPPPGPNPQFCTEICGGGASCQKSCRELDGTWITCGEYAGNPANDLDGDGVANGPDNCNCTSNPSQADCDGDSQGDACDPYDNSWYLHNFSIGTCHVDVDDHVFYETMEMYNKEIWRSACTGATCVRNKLKYDFNCYTDADMSCCLDKSPYDPDCYLAWNYDACGQPKCPF